MQVQLAGARVSEPVSPVSKAGVALVESRIASLSAQIDEAILKYPAGSELVRLLADIARTRVPEASDALLQEAVSAAALGDATQALDAITRLAAVDPARAEALPLHSGLAPIRADVDRLLKGLTLAARLDAETQIAQAAQEISAADSPSPHGLLALANHLYDAGGYANYTDAASIAQAAINTSVYPAALPEPVLGFAPGTARNGGRSFAAFARATQSMVYRLWVRAPLLVLLLGWFGAGLGAGVAMLVFSAAALNATFELWALGLLALVGFGFYMRVRNVRFRTMR
jgi:hypothetical protein